VEGDRDGAGDGAEGAVEAVPEVREETGAVTEVGEGAAEVTDDTACVTAAVVVVVVVVETGNGGNGGAGTVTVGAGGSGGGGSRPAVAVPASSAEPAPTASQTSSRMCEQRPKARTGCAWRFLGNSTQVDVLNRGDDIHTDLELGSLEADEGTRRVIRFDAAERCPACLGRGTTPVGEPCARCGGRGIVEEERRLRLRIPPGLEDGSQLRVPGDGNDAGTDSPPGDLFVHVHVLPSARDPRSVRYFALGLLLVAIAALALYLLRGF
jgi:DnaJ C terminal domain